MNVRFSPIENTCINVAKQIKSHFLVCVLMIDSVMPFRSSFTHEGH